MMPEDQAALRRSALERLSLHFDMGGIAELLEAGLPIDGQLGELLARVIRLKEAESELVDDLPASAAAIRQNRDREIWAFVHVRMMRFARGSRARILHEAAQRFNVSEATAKQAYDRVAKEYADPTTFGLLQGGYWIWALKDLCEEQGVNLVAELSRINSVKSDSSFDQTS